MNMKLLSYRDILTKIFYFGIKKKKETKDDDQNHSNFKYFIIKAFFQKTIQILDRKITMIKNFVNIILFNLDYNIHSFKKLFQKLINKTNYLKFFIYFIK
jgi:hypothetical protein